MTSSISAEDRAAAREAYLAIADKPFTRKLREEKEWFAGVVWWNPADQDIDVLKAELTRMREVGFNAVMGFDIRF